MTGLAALNGTPSPVLFEERIARAGWRVGFATLNSPATLNGLSLDMAVILDAQLNVWADDPRVALVVLRGAGEKAFCAGGDLQTLYRSMLDARGSGGDIRSNRYAADFFATEYRLDYRIHTYPKPILCWGHGIVMGGGIGLMAGASHRVVTERSKLAFPEITVGLYPDVGGSWLLNRVPEGAGRFLALTGAPLGAADAIHAGLADHHIVQAMHDTVRDALLDARWSDDVADNREQLTDVLSRHAQTAPDGPLKQHRTVVARACAGDDLATIVSAIRSIESSDPWLAGARDTLAVGSPGSARLAFELQHRAASLSLADTFRLEYVASLHCAAHGDFAEGIRALLIDKDRKPRWNPGTLEQASPEWAEAFFRAPWTANAHPLADLGHDLQESSR